MDPTPPSAFEAILTSICQTLTAEALATPFKESKAFEQRVRTLLKTRLADTGFEVDLSPKDQSFPDIVLGIYGIEVKFTANDTWRSIANSVSEGSRDRGVQHIYLLFGKMGGTPAVKWAAYENCVIHVRTSHVPRFEVEIPSDGPAKPSLFTQLGIPYSQFHRLPMAEKMKHIRNYARKRLKKGEHLWWVEDQDEPAHSLDLHLRIYTKLSSVEKIQYRAEGVLLCPEVLRGSRSPGKYDNVVSYLLTYRGVLCHQARDLFSAGSVATPGGKKANPGAIYAQLALKNIEAEIKQAADTLEDRLFLEYWGETVPKKDRIKEWLRRADQEAAGWKPSAYLFQ
jgi:hypothetical protein